LKEIEMKAQEQIKRDGSNIQADAMIDLPVTDEPANQTKGGVSGTGKTIAAEVLARELRLDQ
jgi:hypothetical protein